MAGKKTFTAGAVLTASDVNDYLMDQSVMYFGGTAARNSAIPTPTTGMTTYIGTTGTASIPQIETYTGAAWQTPYGMTLVAKASVSGAATIAIDNVFTSTYRNYKVIVALTTVATTGSLSLRLRAGGTTNSSNNYTHAGIGALSSNATTNSYSNGLASDWQIGFVVNAFAGLSSSDLTIYNPQQTLLTTFTGNTMSTSATTNNYMFALGGLMNVTTAYDGFAFSAAGNMTGTIEVYGLRNS